MKEAQEIEAMVKYVSNIPEAALDFFMGWMGKYGDEKPTVKDVRQSIKDIKRVCDLYIAPRQPTIEKIKIETPSGDFVESMDAMMSPGKLGDVILPDIFKAVEFSAAFAARLGKPEQFIYLHYGFLFEVGSVPYLEKVSENGFAPVSFEYAEFGATFDQVVKSGVKEYEEAYLRYVFKLLKRVSFSIGDKFQDEANDNELQMIANVFIKNERNRHKPIGFLAAAFQKVISGEIKTAYGTSRERLEVRTANTWVQHAEDLYLRWRQATKGGVRDLPSHKDPRFKKTVNVAEVTDDKNAVKNILEQKRAQEDKLIEQADIVCRSIEAIQFQINTCKRLDFQRAGAVFEERLKKAIEDLPNDQEINVGGSETVGLFIQRSCLQCQNISGCPVSDRLQAAAMTSFNSVRVLAADVKFMGGKVVGKKFRDYTTIELPDLCAKIKPDNSQKIPH